MTHIHKIAPFAAMAVGVVLALATSAFTNAPKTTVSGAMLYYYTYSGTDQSQIERSKGTNYTNPQTSLSGCNGFTNECAVEVSVTGTAPANISSLSVTHDPTTGFPDGGSDFQENFLQN